MNRREESIPTTAVQCRASSNVERPTAQSQGAIFALGTGNNGMAFYVKGDRLVFDYNLFTRHYKAISDRPIAAGKARLAVRFEKIGKQGKATVMIDDVDCGSVEVPTVLRMISSNGMDAGYDGGSAVSDDYVAPFRFEGRIRRLVFEMQDRSRKDEADAVKAQAAAAFARQ